MSDDSLRLLKALGEKARYDIIGVLSKGERCACEIPELIGKTQSNTSMHLAKLLEMEIVGCRRDGRMIIYGIKDQKALELYHFLNEKKKRRIIA
jgi:ArsR family transcriptional regulator, lead/cadmium/zinc/bismuth-responsive transcriptional repressor